MTAILYKISGEKIPVMPQDGQHFSLKELQAYVGGYIEIFSVPGSDRLMIVNEEGKIKDLPDNILATAFMQGVLLREMILSVMF